MLLRPLLLPQCLFVCVLGAEQPAALVVPIDKKVGPLKLADGTVNFDALFSHLAYVKTKYARAKMPAEFQTDNGEHLIAKRQTDVIPLVGQEDGEWWGGTVTVGTRPAFSVCSTLTPAAQTLSMLTPTTTRPSRPLLVTRAESSRRTMQAVR